MVVIVVHGEAGQELRGLGQTEKFYGPAVQIAGGTLFLKDNIVVFTCNL